MPAPRNTKSLKRRATGGTSASGGSRAKAPAQRQPSEPIEQATAEMGSKRKYHIQPKVLEKIRAADGVPVSLMELSQELEAPRSSVQHAVLKLTKTVPQIEVVTKGQVWRWNSAVNSFGEEASPVSAVPAMTGAQSGVWYEVGVDGLGNPLVRKDGDNEVRRAVPID